MKNEKLIRLLNSIGKTCFIEHYHDFKNCTNKQELAYKIYQANNNRKPDINITRINCAIQLFNNHLEKEALLLIINSNLATEIKNTAQEILLNEKV